MGAESDGYNHNDHQYSWLDQLHTVFQPGNGGIDAQIKQQWGTGTEANPVIENTYLSLFFFFRWK